MSSNNSPSLFSRSVFPKLALLAFLGGFAIGLSGLVKEPIIIGNVIPGIHSSPALSATTFASASDVLIIK